MFFQQATGINFVMSYTVNIFEVMANGLPRSENISNDDILIRCFSRPRNLQSTPTSAQL
jgi:hypothetical protein